MADPIMQAGQMWLVITHLGSATLILPTFVLTMAALWQSRQRAAAAAWLFGLALGTAVTLISKILFIGWGIGVRSLDFTGVSGHALLATSVLPVLCSLLFWPDQLRYRVAGAVFGLLVAALVGISRVVLSAHSVSEVVCAWLIGLVVVFIAVGAMKDQTKRPWVIYIAPCVLLIAFSTKHANYLPTHDWEIKFALFVSGHDKPYTRPPLDSSAKDGN